MNIAIARQNFTSWIDFLQENNDFEENLNNSL